MAEQNGSASPQSPPGGTGIGSWTRARTRAGVGATSPPPPTQGASSGGAAAQSPHVISTSSTSSSSSPQSSSSSPTLSQSSRPSVVHSIAGLVRDPTTGTPSVHVYGMGGGVGSRLQPPAPPPPLVMTGSSPAALAPTSTSTSNSTPTLSRTSSLQGARVSLSNPRPETQRTVNEYVETPLRQTSDNSINPRTSSLNSKRSAGDNGAPLHETLHLPVSKKSLSNNNNNNNNNISSLSSDKRDSSGDSGVGKVITKQPKSSSGLSTFKKDCGADVTARSGAGEEEWSIICKQCGKCRCEACRQPKSVPSRWICNNQCFCSLESCVDFGSCLCCVKGVLYHCTTRDGDDDTCADEPCDCGPDRRTKRWACLALTSIILPCLWCYWPLRCMASACELCYARYSSRGCRCSSKRQTRTSVFPQKRLLDSSLDI